MTEDMKKEIIEFLKENLTISVSNDSCVTIDNPVYISIYLCGEEIACAGENDGKHSEGYYWT